MMQRVVALVIGILSLIPFAVLLFGIFYFNFIVPHESASLEVREAFYNIFFDVLLPAGFVLALVDVGVVFLTNRVPKTKRILWTVVLLVLNIYAIPFFWYHYIWKNPSKQKTADCMQKKTD